MDIIKDIFVKIIDLAKSGENISLDLKIGFINIDSDRKLYFVNSKDNTTLPDALYMQNRTLQGPLSVAKASGPKSTMSHISNLTNLRSVKTPMTMDATSVTSKAHSSKWSFFKGNNPQCDTDSRKSKNNTVRSENRRKVGSEIANNQTIVQTGNVPYPHLASFINRHTDYRYGKRMGKATNLDNKTVMQEQLEQIQEKTYKEMEDKLRLREEELRGCLSLVDDIDRDQKEREIDIMTKRRDFMKAIDDLKLQKIMKTQLERTSSREYEYSYFPFTHGDNIERKRKDIADKLKYDMKEHYKNKKTTFIEDAITNKSSLRTPLSQKSRLSSQGAAETYK